MESNFSNNCSCTEDVKHIDQLCQNCQDEYYRIRLEMEQEFNQAVENDPELVEFLGRRAA